MTEKLVIVLDCGATNVRAIAVDAKGNMPAAHSIPNTTRPDPRVAGGLIWDVEEIWGKFMTSLREILKKINPDSIAGITCTTFGVDGAPVKKDGTLVNPVISWACNRTTPYVEKMNDTISADTLYRINGLQGMPYNTIYKLAWYKEHAPELLEQADHYAFISSLFLHKLCGEWVTDTSMAGTSMLTDHTKREFSDEIFKALGLSGELFPHMVEPGEVVGQLTSQAESETGLPAGTPVIAAGHDTQFAVFGAGAEANQPVLSSGTWEILFIRSAKFISRPELRERGLTTEYDARPGHFNTGVQWAASGAVEWMKKMFYAGETGRVYDLMEDEAAAAGIGSEGVFVHPCFVPKVGPSAPFNTHGSILGLTVNSSRGAVCRAFFEALSFQLREGLGILEEVGNFKADSVICVGGGSKNKIWNQMRADVLGIPVKLISQTETTVLGAALFALAGAGIYNSPEEARSHINYGTTTITPSENTTAYEPLYQRFLNLAKNLNTIYK